MPRCPCSVEGKNTVRPSGENAAYGLMPSDVTRVRTPRAASTSQTFRLFA